MTSELIELLKSNPENVTSVLWLLPFMVLSLLCFAYSIFSRFLDAVEAIFGDTPSDEGDDEE